MREYPYFIFRVRVFKATYRCFLELNDTRIQGIELNQWVQGDLTLTFQYLSSDILWPSS